MLQCCSGSLCPPLAVAEALRAGASANGKSGDVVFVASVSCRAAALLLRQAPSTAIRITVEQLDRTG